MPTILQDHSPTMADESRPRTHRFAAFARGSRFRASTGSNDISRRSFVQRMGVAGLAVAGATFGTLQLGSESAEASPGCCNLRFLNNVKPLSEMNNCGCTGSDKYIWTCPTVHHSGTPKYCCGECYCESYSTYGGCGSF